MSRYSEAFVIAARRTAIGRPGGLHRSRRMPELAAMALSGAMSAAALAPREIDALILGNSSEGDNPARLAGLAAGLPDTMPAFTIDRNCASGLEAVLSAVRLIALGEAGIVAAGGAQSLSTAPWRLSRPRSSLQAPRFLEANPGPDQAELEASEALAAGAGISRKAQDDYATAARKAGAVALLSGRIGREIASFGQAPAENRDEAPYIAEKGLELDPFLDETGTLTAANTCHAGDGAAIAIVVNEAAWKRLGSPSALRLVGTASVGARPGAEAAAPIDAVEALLSRLGDAGVLSRAEIEINETSAAQVLAFSQHFGLAGARVNGSGGALASGRPCGAGSAVLLARLLSGIAAEASGEASRHHLAVTGAHGGAGLAALFEAVSA